jgi:O-acetyl-ADP-ribose deacetylase (regulator of RNase III)
MIEFRHGDILRTDAEALVNTVNCVGVMGRGIALQFKKAFPENFKYYKAVCDKKEIQPGRMVIHELNRILNPRYIINFPTKRHWKGMSKIEDIESGLKALVTEVRSRNIQSIAVPPLGCGLGGLDWKQVLLLIETAFHELPDVHVMLFEPKSGPAAEDMVKAKQIPEMTVGRASLVALMRCYLAAVMDPFISLLEIHKLMYFMQEAGEPLRLRYSKAIYGPYSENLRHVLTLLEGHFILGYGDANDDPETHIELIPGAVEQAENFLKHHSQTNTRFDSVVKLIEGFETPFGMELLATVHWVVTRDGADSLDKAIKRTYNWNDRKQMFKEKHIQIAWTTLNKHGWLENN